MLHLMHPTDHLNETTVRIWEGVEARLRDMGLSPISHKIYQKPYLSIYDSVGYPVGWCVLDFIKFDGEGLRPRGNTRAPLRLCAFGYFLYR
jgi:hypothetical protein